MLERECYNEDLSMTARVCGGFSLFGEWLSLVEHLVRDRMLWQETPRQMLAPRELLFALTPTESTLLQASSTAALMPFSQHLCELMLPDLYCCFDQWIVRIAGAEIP